MLRLKCSMFYFYATMHVPNVWYAEYRIMVIVYL